MRNIKEIYKLILDIAQKDKRIRAVVLNGSRANPNIQPDIFQDFDIIYYVTDVESIVNESNWHKQFGELMIMQMPETMQDSPPNYDAGFMYLMQFTDGNRIDLGLYPIAKVADLKQDSLSVLLLDKDEVFAAFPKPNESSYLPKPPTAKNYADCSNEFWWVATYVAKALWRQEITYAQAMLELIRLQLTKMLSWHLGIKTSYKKNLGKEGKYFQKYLEPELWKLLENTYVDASIKNTWDALFTMLELFRISSHSVSKYFDFIYPQSDDDKVTTHLKHVRFLATDAKSLY